jgi:hypothetical protein
MFTTSEGSMHRRSEIVNRLIGRMLTRLNKTEEDRAVDGRIGL